MPENCVVCDKPSKRTQKILTCGSCSAVHHLHCTNLSEADLQTLEDLGKSWICLTCTSDNRSKRRDDTPVGSPLLARRPKALMESSDGMLKELLQRVTDLQDGQREFERSIKAELSSINRTMSQWQRTIEEHTKSIAFLNETINSVNTKTDSIVEETKALQKRINYLELRLSATEQNSLRNVMDIHGISQKRDEKPETIVCQMASVLGVSLTPSDIDYCYWVSVRSNKNAPSVQHLLKVRFLRHNLVCEFLAARRARKNLSAKDLGCDGNRTIYIDEALSTFNRRLYSAARELKKQGKLKYLWIRNGSIFVRKEDGGRRITIRCEADLETL
ncbi:uncharacterized protein LOC124158171 [Ischnura elegans]|uniref:uncharacterized protein LOC124158171 n=1 Tax=Ischnura elegans TaxID=197161 RepID=UPI001ED8A66A|nr:uncharacterized protein LOC124158171 [Ischnura elegans]